MYLQYLIPLVLFLSSFGGVASSSSLEQAFIHKPILIPHYNHLHFRKQGIEEHLGEYDRYKDLSQEVFIETVNGKSCAVVGSSSNLIGSKYGAFIDSHDVVFRINDAPVKAQYAKDIGNKTTVWLMHGDIKDLPLDLKCGNQFFMIPDYHPELNKSFSKYYKQIVLWHRSEVKTLHKSSEYKIKTLSSGLVAVYYAMSLCKEVDVFGFGADKFGQRGYYHDTNQIFNYYRHDPKNQDLFLAELARQKQINLYMGNAQKKDL